MSPPLTGVHPLKMAHRGAIRVAIGASPVIIYDAGNVAYHGRGGMSRGMVLVVMLFGGVIAGFLNPLASPRRIAP